MSNIDPEAELQAVRQRRQAADRRGNVWRRSRLDRWRSQLVELRQAGGSYEDLRTWLRSRRCRVAKSTLIHSMKHRWPESPDFVSNA